MYLQGHLFDNCTNTVHTYYRVDKDNRWWITIIFQYEKFIGWTSALFDPTLVLVSSQAVIVRRLYGLAEIVQVWERVEQSSQRREIVWNMV